MLAWFDQEHPAPKIPRTSVPMSGRVGTARLLLSRPTTLALTMSDQEAPPQERAWARLILASLSVVGSMVSWQAPPRENDAAQRERNAWGCVFGSDP